MKRFVGYVIDKAVKALPRKKKVSPDIKSVKPTKDIKGSVKRAKSDAYVKNIDDLNKARKKITEGKKMMKEGQKLRKQMVGTKRAFQFKGSPSYHAIEPGDADKFKRNMKKPKPDKKFKTAKQMEKEDRRKKDREPFMGGGFGGRRMGYSQGSNGKPVSRSKNPGLLKMSKSEKGKAVVKKFGYNPNRIVAKKGGKA
jgi:hypothetical protein